MSASLRSWLRRLRGEVTPPIVDPDLSSLSWDGLDVLGMAFAELSDDADSPFYRAPGLSSAETQKRIAANMDRLLRGLLDKRRRDERIELSPESLIQWHRVLFEDTFPSEAGRLRWRSADGAWEQVYFGILAGSAKTRRLHPRKGAHPRRVQARLVRTFDRYERERAELLARGQGSLIEVTTLATHLYAKTLSIHPFVDGNLRACFVALQAVLLNFDLPIVWFKDLTAHDERLGMALRPGGRQQSYGPLAELVAEHIRALEKRSR